MGNKKTARRGQDDDAILHTHEFAGRMIKALIDTLSAQGYHLIIEGTLRTQSEERTSFYQ